MTTFAKKAIKEALKHKRSIEVKCSYCLNKTRYWIVIDDKIMCNECFKDIANVEDNK